MLLIDAKCSHFKECGGCSSQNRPYEAQVLEKQAAIEKIFTPLLQNQSPVMHPIIPCEKAWEYRNKMEFSFSQNKAGDYFLGLMMKGKQRVVDLYECHLVSPWFSHVLAKVRQWWKESGLLAYRHSQDSGHLRTLIVREAKNGKGKLVMLTVSGNPDFAIKRAHIESFVSALKSTLAESDHPVLSIFLRVQQIKKGSSTQFYEMLLSGPDHMMETLNIRTTIFDKQLHFKISPSSFFQPNTQQAELLYSTALNMLRGLTHKLIFDLYCGTATFGLCVAEAARHVVGIEINPHAVFDAGVNKEINGIENFTIHNGDVGTVLEKLKIDEPPDLVIVDPPRAGLDERALKNIIHLSPKEILYISCNPRSQADNIKILIDAGYRLSQIQPIDQFPHTSHVENIVLLIK
ncbi:MAG TPA: 23S rRNA (uracil(1939)-C(5))-methyltransferase RlmD [Rhabdochlamydiaceae bacterium]|nr:23S rRNA (uracil(1939)-C(5))-methyltransferase RlmD [Rhabdochlamydiaceae bacterium]